MALDDRAALKAKVYDAMMALEAQELATAQEHYDAFLKGSRLDPTESHDTDELADARESADLAAAFDHPVQTHHAKVDVLENLDFSLQEVVRPGAIVVLDDRRFVVAVSTARFECEGQTYMGISAESPIYKAMAGLRAGDSFAFQGRELDIDDVL